MRSPFFKVILTFLLVTGWLEAQAGVVLRVSYDGIPGNDVASLTNSAIFPSGNPPGAGPSGPLFVEILQNALSIVDPNDIDPEPDYYQNYGTYTRGYISVPETGNYRFFVASDDGSELRLSTDHTPENAVVIARETGCCTPVFSGARLDQRSSGFIHLEKNKRYWFGLLHKEGVGGSFVSVGWEKPDGTREIVPGHALSPFPLNAQLQPVNADPTIVAAYPTWHSTPFAIDNAGQPADAVVDEVAPAIFFVTAEVTEPATYQWLKDGAPIAGEQGPFLVIPQASMADNGSKYSVKISRTGGSSVTSDEATLIVNPDVVAPTVLGADPRGNPNGLTVQFSEPVAEASALDKANYSIDGGAVTIENVVLTSPTTVRLEIGGTGWVLNTDHTVTVQNIQDRAFTPNTIAATTLNFSYAAGDGFLYNFNDGKPDNLNLYGAAKVVATGGPDGSGYLSINDAAGSLVGAALFTERFNIKRVNFKFKVRVGNGSGNPADGFSFNVADDLPEGTYPQSEEGYGGSEGNVAVNGLVISFDNWDSGGSDPSPSIEVKYGGQSRGNVLVPKQGNTAVVVNGVPSIYTGDRWVDVEIDLQPDGKLYLTYDGYRIFNGVDTGFQGLENAQIGFGGRTGGAWETHWFDDLIVNFQPTLDQIGPVVITTDPVDATADENTAATFSVSAKGAGPFTYQWFKNGEAIAGANSDRFTTPEVTPGDNNAKFTVKVSNEFSEATSAEATLTVVNDTVVPTLVNAAVPGPSLTRVDVTFSERMDEASAENVANYALDKGVQVTGAELQPNKTTVHLTTSAMAEGTLYTLTVNNVADIAAAQNKVMNGTDSFTTWAIQKGGLTALIYPYSGGGLGGFYPSPRGVGQFPPDNRPFGPLVNDGSSGTTPFFEYPPGPSLTTPPPADVMNNYGTVLYGFIAPKETAAYDFYIAADDNAELYLSTDENPANAQLIAAEPGWNPVRDYAGTARRNADAPENRSTTLFPAGIQLEAGKRYYVEAIAQEGGGGDNLAVAWRKHGEPAPGTGSAPISGEFLVALLPVPEEPQVLAMQPGNNTIDVSADTTIQFSLRNGATAAILDSIKLLVDGQEVAADISSDLGLITVTYDPPSHFEGMTVHSAELVYNIASDPVQTRRAKTTFRTTPLVPGTVFMEAEDYNYDGGNYIPGANGGPTGQPYPGGAYVDLAGIEGIDYRDNGGGGGDPPYRTSSPNVATVGFGDANRGTFNVQQNWKVGWTGNGEWLNWTREFPEDPTPYEVWARISSGGSAPNPTLQRVISDPSQPDQKLEQLGQFTGDQSGDWGVMLFYKLHRRGDQTKPAIVTLAGVNTIRLTVGSGNMDLNYVAFTPIDLPPASASDLQIVQQPESITTTAGTTATFTVGATSPENYGIVYQWQKDGVDIPFATGSSYTTPVLSEADSGAKYSAVLKIHGGVVKTTAEATLTVVADTIAPKLVSARPDFSFGRVVLTFDEDVDATGATFTLNNGATVTSSTASGKTVTLETSQLTPGTRYTVTMSGVKDTLGNTIAASSTTQFTAWTLARGAVLWQAYTGIPGVDINSLTTDPRFPNAPDTFRIIPRMDMGGGGEFFGNDYGARMTAWLIPEETASYDFFVRVDDQAQLYLSSDENPLNAVLIASDTTDPCCQAFQEPGVPETTAAPIALEAGKRYFMEFVMKEGGGGDWAQVAWRKVGDTTAAASLQPIPSRFFETYVPVPEELIVRSVSPGDGNTRISTLPTITAVVEEGGIALTPASVQLTLNGEVVSHTTTTTTSGPLKVHTISHTVTEGLEPSSVNTVGLTFTDASGKTYSRQWKFETTFFPAGTIFIEAEDYNYEGGKFVPDANGGPTGAPYAGGAYAGLAGIPEVDYKDNGGGGSGTYRAFLEGAPNVATVAFGNTSRSTFSVSSNWKVGWTGNGEWLNYTRDFGPAREFEVYASISSGHNRRASVNPTLQLVTGDTSQPDQTLEQLGGFTGVPFGSWNTMLIYRLHDVGLPAVPKNVALEGVNTVRLTIGSGPMDFDYLAFVPVGDGVVTPPTPEFTSIVAADGQITLEWKGGGTLEFTTSLDGGTWTEVTGANSPHSEAIVAGQARFYRIKR